MSDYFLSKGSHESPAEGRCAMEWVAYLAGEPHGDQPACVDPILRRFGIVLNDRLDDEDRQKLRPYLARCIGTVGDGRADERRQLLTEYLLRTSVPRYLDAAGLHDAAARVRALPLNLTSEAVQTLRDVREEAQVARSAALRKLTAYAAATDAATAYAAATDAAADAATATAATDAAYAAATDAAYAATAAADAAVAAYAAYAAVAAYAAAAAKRPSKPTYEKIYEACRKAADQALAPHRERALEEALDLFDQMLPTEPIQMPVAADADAVCSLSS